MPGIGGHYTCFFLFRSGFPIKCSYMWDCSISKGTQIILMFFHDLFTADRFYLSGKHLINSFQCPVCLFFFNDKGKCEPYGMGLFAKNPQNLQFFCYRPDTALATLKARGFLRLHCTVWQELPIFDNNIVIFGMLLSTHVRIVYPTDYKYIIISVCYNKIYVLSDIGI